MRSWVRAHADDFRVSWVVFSLTLTVLGPDIGNLTCSAFSTLEAVQINDKKVPTGVENMKSLVSPARAPADDSPPSTKTRVP
jgi:hypothetical protein